MIMFSLLHKIFYLISINIICNLNKWTLFIIKGKGAPPTYWLLGSKTFDKSLPVPPEIGLVFLGLRYMGAWRTWADMYCLKLCFYFLFPLLYYLIGDTYATIEQLSHLLRVIILLILKINMYIYVYTRCSESNVQF